jgi:hypothetical protein
VAIARKEQDPALKKEIVQRMGQMGNNSDVKAYLIEILSK